MLANTSESIFIDQPVVVPAKLEWYVSARAIEYNQSATSGVIGHHHKCRTVEVDFRCIP